MGSTYRELRIPAKDADQAIDIAHELERRQEDPRYLDDDGFTYDSSGTFLDYPNKERFVVVDYKPDPNRSHAEFGRSKCLLYDHRDGTWSVFGWCKD